MNQIKQARSKTVQSTQALHKSQNETKFHKHRIKITGSPYKRRKYIKRNAFLPDTTTGGVTAHKRGENKKKGACERRKRLRSPRKQY